MMYINRQITLCLQPPVIGAVCHRSTFILCSAGKFTAKASIPESAMTLLAWSKLHPSVIRFRRRKKQKYAWNIEKACVLWSFDRS